jgi:uncharacterized protein YdiU (UPF0061 family)
VGRAQPFEAGLDVFSETLERRSLEMFAGKLGLRLGDLARVGDPEEPGTVPWLINEGTSILQAARTDMTIFYRELADVPVDAEVGDEALLAPLRDAYYDPDALPAGVRDRTLRWLRMLGARVRDDGMEAAERRALMQRANPRYVLRNYLAQLAIDDAEKGDPGLLHELLDVMRRPYEDQPGRERFAEKRPTWAENRAGCSMLSCSS